MTTSSLPNDAVELGSRSYEIVIASDVLADDVETIEQWGSRVDGRSPFGALRCDIQLRLRSTLEQVCVDSTCAEFLRVDVIVVDQVKQEVMV